MRSVTAHARATAGPLHDPGSPAAARSDQARLGAHHFAYLRTLAEGMDAKEAARRYFPIAHGAEIPALHRAIIERVRAVARRRGDSRWRLIGIEIREVPAVTAAPAIDVWAEEEGLDDWSQAELLDLYQERFGGIDGDPAQRRRRKRNTRLRERRLQLLRELERMVGETARPSDLLEGWLAPELVDALHRSGTLTLGGLQVRIGRGGRWWSVIKGYGPVKAARLASQVRQLLVADDAADVVETVAHMWPAVAAGQRLAGLSGANGRNRVHGTYAGTEARDDREAVAAWIAARAKSELTKKQYGREADRFILWCALERGRALSDATAEDCNAYMEFLADVPDTWVSRNNVPRLTPGWAPFKGQLTIASRQYALAALHSLFAWLVSARYLASNPWVLVNRKLGDDPRGAHGALDDTASRAFTPAAWTAMLHELDAALASPSIARLRWICTFVEATGLRAAELLTARAGDLVRFKGGWVLKVHGKGRRNRTVPVPKRVHEATREYLASRLIELEVADPATPLLGSLTEPKSGVSYGALHETFTRFLARALKALPPQERRRARRASMHWLRHTHATRAAEANVPPDVLQENLGQSDPRTTARYYRAQLERRQREMERVYGEVP